MFRRAAQLAGWLPKDGDAVELRGRLAVYEPRGELQFVVEAMQRSGAGALYERFLRLKARLEAAGAVRCRRRSARCRRFRVAIGVVTSLGGAALHDVATTLARRSPHVRVVVYPSLVQGVDAPAALCAAIATAAARAEVDVLVVCRGGGSLEDLWAFNDERVVRALALDADAGGERRRPRDRRHPGRSRGRPARAHAHGRGRAGRGGDRHGAGAARFASRRAGPAHPQRAWSARRSGSTGSPCAWRGRARPWRDAATASICWRNGSRAAAGRDLARRRRRDRCRRGARAQPAGARPGAPGRPPRVGGDPPRCGRSGPGAGPRLCLAARCRRPCACPRSGSCGRARPCGRRCRTATPASRCARSCRRPRRDEARPRARRMPREQAAYNLRATPTAQEERHGTHPAPAAVCEERAGARA